MKRFTYALKLIAIFLISLFCLTADAKAEPVDSENPVASAASVSESDISTLKETSAYDLYLTVGQKKVYFPEVSVYALGTRDKFETDMGRGDFWSFEVKNAQSAVTSPGAVNTVGSLAADDIRRELIEIKVIVAEAENEGITLTDDEEKELMETAKTQLANVSAKIKAAYFLDENVLYMVYHDNFLAAKFYSEFMNRARYEHPGKSGEKLFTREFKKRYSSTTVGYDADKWQKLDVGAIGTVKDENDSSSTE